MNKNQTFDSMYFGKIMHIDCDKDATLWYVTVNEDRGSDASRLPTHAYAPRFQSRSATATPTTSPKKRQLPQIPHHQVKWSFLKISDHRTT